mmetsp:Transcript_49840/g.105986  ORF Transcript_49840/g.105986 Transcript_49840/m.105986 type:complete len:85 (-) Transcript_49840:66-320(-)
MRFVQACIPFQGCQPSFHGGEICFTILCAVQNEQRCDAEKGKLIVPDLCFCMHLSLLDTICATANLLMDLDQGRIDSEESEMVL